MSNEPRYISHAEARRLMDPVVFDEIFKNPEEQRHDHKLVYVDGRVQWEETTPTINGRDWIEYAITLPKPERKPFYRGGGYSLFGYWEVFYWDMNN